MSQGASLEFYGLGTGLMLIGSGIWGILRSQQLARRNQAYIDSGKESYFEERRAWKYYPSTRPLTDPARIRGASWLGLAVGIVMLLLDSPLSIFHWSWLA